MAWLNDNPPARSQFRHPRREQPSGVVIVHTAENSPDYQPPDTGAESVAKFIRNRADAGSYHDLCDSDSCIQLVDYGDEAYGDATGSNRHGYHVSVATRAALWPDKPEPWRYGAITQAAAAARRYADWLQANYGTVIPAQRISREQSEARQPGFITHAERDPANRSDPGWGDREWDLFFNLYTATEEPDLTDDQAAQLKALFDRVATIDNVGFSVLGGQGHPSMRDVLAYVPSTNAAVARLETSVHDKENGIYSKVVRIEDKVKLLTAGGGTIDIDALAARLAEVLAKRLEQ